MAPRVRAMAFGSNEGDMFAKSRGRERGAERDSTIPKAYRCPVSMERSIGGRPAFLFVLTPANQLCRAQSSQAGREQRQTERFGDRRDACICLRREQNPCDQ